MTATDPLALALDRFDVPPMSAGLASRIAAAVAPVTPPRAALRHDRRGLWRRGRQVVISTVAAGMVSAAAVASGLLDHTGIEVPVLTAMLSPAHRRPVKIHHEHKIAVVAREHKASPAASKPAVAKVAAAAPLMAIPPSPAQPTMQQLMRRELAMERRDARIAFAQTHPRAAAAMAQRQRKRLARAALLRGQPLTPGALDPALQSLRSSEFRTERAMAIQARRDRRAALGLPIEQAGRSGRDVNGAGSADADHTARTDRQIAAQLNPIESPAPANSAPAVDADRQQRRVQMQRAAAGRQILRQQMANELRAERQARRHRNTGNAPRFQP